MQGGGVQRDEETAERGRGEEHDEGKVSEWQREVRFFLIIMWARVIKTLTEQTLLICDGWKKVWTRQPGGLEEEVRNRRKTFLRFVSLCLHAQQAEVFLSEPTCLCSHWVSTGQKKSEVRGSAGELWKLLQTV